MCEYEFEEFIISLIDLYLYSILIGWRDGVKYFMIHYIFFIMLWSSISSSILSTVNPSRDVTQETTTYSCPCVKTCYWELYDLKS